MTWLAWLAVLGPVGGAALGLLVGFFMGKLSDAEELGEMRERLQSVTAQLEGIRARQSAAAASPPSRRESGRVLDLVTPPGAA